MKKISVIGLLNTNEENAKAKSDTMHHTKIIVPERGERRIRSCDK